MIELFHRRLFFPRTRCIGFPGVCLTLMCDLFGLLHITVKGQG